MGCIALGACAQQYSPSLMNTSKIELSRETHMEQIPHNMVDDLSMAILADQYTRYGTGPLELTMTYDPSSKTFTAMKALQELKKAEGMLKKKGIAGVKTSTLPVAGESPALMVLYPSAKAQAPSSCGTMPGLTNNATDVQRDIDNGYRIGCGIETMLAQQVYRPADLEGRGGDAMGVNEGRRLTNVVETYHVLNDREEAGELDLQRTLEREALESE
jgi:type IV pilus biogenesis protein CpaD/CtpE